MIPYPVQKNNFSKILIGICCFELFFVVQTFCQATPQPTRVSGTNSLAWNQDSSECYFKLGNDILYKYSIGTGKHNWETGATLTALMAKTQNGRYFWPSVCAGISAWFSNAERYPGEMLYEKKSFTRSGDTIRTRWRMKYEKNPNEFLDYTYRFYISGRTLVLQVQVDSSTKAVRFLLERSMEPDTTKLSLNAQIVRIPSMTLFNVLSYDGSFVSIFFDWEVTNASQLIPCSPVRYSRTSVWYAQDAIYNTLSDGYTRNRLKETIYLTISPNLNEVLPNIPVPAASRRSQALGKNILVFDPPYNWSTHASPCNNPSYNYLDSVHSLGVKNLCVIMKTWQRHGFDRDFPKVLPANIWEICENDCKLPLPRNDHRGDTLLSQICSYIVNSLKYSFALHENYVDYYPGTDQYHQFDCAIDNNNFLVKGWKNSCGEQASVIKPSKASTYATHWSHQIREAIFKNSPRNIWSYLDVHSSANPSYFVDYDKSKDSAGMFLYTLKRYRELPAIFQTAYDGPVQGEGGNHFLYAGYFDDLEARIQTADYSVYGQKAPLLVDFDILKIRPKSALHGVGQSYNFFDIPNTATGNRDTIGTAKMLQIVATELAYGHAGLTTVDIYDPDRIAGDHSLTQLVLEEQHVLPIYNDIANAKPVSILYAYGNTDPTLTASEYICKYPNYWNYQSDDFMSRVKIMYDNGVVVIVNRSSTLWTNVTIGTSGGWFAYNTTSHGLNTGKVANNKFSLSAKNGWVCYDPLIGF